MDWSERWIQALIAFHVTLWLITVTTRRRFWLQTTIFFAVCLLVFSAERLNSLAHEHWQSFSKQDYFDDHGVFTVTMYAAPLLMLGFAQMVRIDQPLRRTCSRFPSNSGEFRTPILDTARRGEACGAQIDTEKEAQLGCPK